MRPRPTCIKCGRNPVKKKGMRGDYQKYHRVCSTCWKNERGYKAHRKEVCERCGFVPEHMCQLHVDHIDGDHSNDDPANLQTLCANCHALKTVVNGEQYKDRPKPSQVNHIQVALDLFFD